MLSLPHLNIGGFPGGLEVKAFARNMGDPGSIPGSGRSWRRKWQPTPVFLPGESHGERSLVPVLQFPCLLKENFQELSSQVCLEQ